MICKTVLVAAACCATVLAQSSERDAQPSPDALALTNLNRINVAAHQYYSAFQQIPTTLQQLGPTNGLVADRDAADLIPKSLADGPVAGYRFALRASKTGWIVTATPIERSENRVQFVYKIESRMLHPASRTAK
jgi:hypothetical protein